MNPSLPPDNCCYRYCNKDYRVCSNGEVGCSYDSDCVAGVVCDTSLEQPKCVDIDECDIDNTLFNGTSYCGIGKGSFNLPEKGVSKWIYLYIGEQQFIHVGMLNTKF